MRDSAVSRRNFLKGTLLLSGLAGFRNFFVDDTNLSPFAERLKPVGRRLEMEGWYIWCNSPIYGPDGKVHVFFSRWPARHASETINEAGYTGISLHRGTGRKVLWLHPLLFSNSNPDKQ